MNTTRNTTTSDPRTPEYLRNTILADRVKRILGGIPTLRLVLETGDGDPTPAEARQRARVARILAECRTITGGR